MRLFIFNALINTFYECIYILSAPLAATKLAAIVKVSLPAFIIGKVFKIIIYLVFMKIKRSGHEKEK